MAESLHILILEDNPVDAELAEFELQEAGYSFTSKVVVTEKDFIRELQDSSLDLILSDYDLPQYNGALALAEAGRRCPDTPFILVTGAVGEDRAIEILTQGAKDYVLKTRLQQRLVPAVRRALAEAEEHRARKQAEDELREAHRTLEERVKIRTRELEAEVAERKKAEMALKDQTQQLEDANRELESFSYSVSHDLKAPLRAIDGYSRMLMKKYGHTLGEDAVHLVDVIRSNTEMMRMLIDDLLSFSRVLKGNMTVLEIDMEELAGEVWDEIQAANKERELEFRIDKLLPGYGDQIFIRQVVFNLIDNAIKFSKHRKPGIIEMHCCREDEQIAYCVKDNGVGFDMAYYNKLFGVFQRLHNREEYEGTGVGLAIVQRIISRHGGRVWAEAKVNEGAAFYFSLPATETGTR